jgi:hypothetical protein
MQSFRQGCGHKTQRLDPSGSRWRQPAAVSIAGLMQKAFPVIWTPGLGAVRSPVRFRRQGDRANHERRPSLPRHARTKKVEVWQKASAGCRQSMNSYGYRVPLSSSNAITSDRERLTPMSVESARNLKDVGVKAKIWSYRAKRGCFLP